jgi:hypothetical protein
MDAEVICVCIVIKWILLAAIDQRNQNLRKISK